MGLRKEMQNWFDIVELSKGLKDTGQQIGEQNRAQRLRDIAAQAPQMLSQPGGAEQFAAQMGANGDTALIRQLAAQKAAYSQQEQQGLSQDQLMGMGIPQGQVGAFTGTSLEKQKMLLDQKQKKEEQAFKRSLFDVKEATKVAKTIDKDIPQAQANAAGFYKMMEPSHKRLDSILETNPGIIARLSEQQLLQAINAPENIKDQGLKQFATAARAFLNSQLRKESGAAISESEFSNGRQQYIPMSGDGADVLADKRDNRVRAMAGMKTAAGKRAIENVDKQYQELSGANDGSMKKKKQAGINSRMALVKDPEIKAALEAKIAAYEEAGQDVPDAFIQKLNALVVGD